MSDHNPGRGEREQTLRMAVPPMTEPPPADGLDDVEKSLRRSIDKATAFTGLESELFDLLLQTLGVLRSFRDASGQRYNALEQLIATLEAAVRDLSARVTGLGADVVTVRDMLGQLGVSVDTAVEKMAQSSERTELQYDLINKSLQLRASEYLDHMAEHASRDEIAKKQATEATHRESVNNEADLERDEKLKALQAAKEALETEAADAKRKDAETEKQLAMATANVEALGQSLATTRDVATDALAKAKSARRWAIAGKSGGALGVLETLLRLSGDGGVVGLVGKIASKLIGH